MTYDAIVIGGSYAGLSAALQLARANRPVLVIDAGEPRNKVSDAARGYLGLDGSPPAEIINAARAQLLAYPVATLIQSSVTGVEAGDSGFVVTTADGTQEEGRRLLLATGVVDVLPSIAGAAERWGHSLHICPYCHGHEVNGRTLGVIASHALSAPGAAMLPDWGPTTYFTQGEFEPDEQFASWLAARNVPIERTPIVEMLGPAPEMEAVRLADGRVMPLDCAFTSPIVRLRDDLAEQLGCAIDTGAFGPAIRVEGAATTVNGVFAAGDATGDKQAISHAVSAGASAAVATHRSLVLEDVKSPVQQATS